MIITPKSLKSDSPQELSWQTHNHTSATVPAGWSFYDWNRQGVNDTQAPEPVAF
ncbi:MAG: hypothetical protein MK179_14900 [Pirellulaceae bacterium]|nr:hypothetical protein [Pirellulaceae bacterium]